MTAVHHQLSEELQSRSAHDSHFMQTSWIANNPVCGSHRSELRLNLDLDFHVDGVSHRREKISKDHRSAAANVERCRPTIDFEESRKRHENDVEWYEVAHDIKAAATYDAAAAFPVNELAAHVAKRRRRG